MKILLTGSKGNLGSHIIKFSSHEILGIDREDQGKLDDILASGVDVVIHAAYDLKNKIEEKPCLVMDSNLTSTTKLLEAIKKYGVKRLIFISSCAVYGDSLRTNEEITPAPFTINGLTKLLNERIIELYCLKNNIKFKIYRVFNMYGGEDRFSVLSKLKRGINDQVAFCLNNQGIAQRDFVHVEDVAKIILKLLDLSHPFKYLNIGTGIAVRIADIFDRAKKKYPSLAIEHSSTPEVEYSRADITKLSSLVDYKFINILDFIDKDF